MLWGPPALRSHLPAQPLPWYLTWRSSGPRGARGLPEINNPEYSQAPAVLAQQQTQSVRGTGVINGEKLRRGEKIFHPKRDIAMP